MINSVTIPEVVQGYRPPGNEIMEAAYRLKDAGFSPLAIKNGEKRPSHDWTEFQARTMTAAEIELYFKTSAKIGVACGIASRNVECLDFDDPDIFDPFMELLEVRCPGLAEKIQAVTRRTPSGGYHCIYRCDEPVSGNLKLACKEGHGTDSVMIETRGQGGQFVTAPSPGYTVVKGSILTDCPVLAGEELKIVHATARAFDQRQTDTARPRQEKSDDAPGHQFNKANRIEDILLAQDWKPSRKTTAGQGWTRPGKEEGVSGVLLASSGNFYVWSSNSAPLEPNRSYDAFGLYAMYEHGGDYPAAARQLAQDGYGSNATGEKTEWPEPSPLSRKEESLPYPLDALPAKIGGAVCEVTEFVQCPTAMTACSALSVVSIVAQGLVDVRRAEKLDGPTSLYLMAVADSGERKTTVDNFFSKPVYAWEAEKAIEAEPVLAEWEAFHEAWKAEKAGLTEAIRSAAKTGKSTHEHKKKLVDLEKRKPEKPKVPRLIYLDATPESLAYNLAKTHPVGGILSSEGGSVFGSHGMGKDSIMRNLSAMNCLWENTRLIIDRRTVESFTVNAARLTMGLAVQAETIKTFVDGTNGLARGIGFLARFLLAWPETTQGKRMFKDPPDHWPELAKFHQRVNELLDTELAYNQRGELAPHMLELSREAKSLWVSFHDDVERELAPGRALAEARDVASKAADNAARLAALFHVFENGMVGTVGDAHMRAAGRIVAWHLSEAKRFLGEIETPPEIRNAARLDEWLVAHCKSKMVSHVRTNIILQYGPPCTRRKRNLDAALAELADAGRIRLTPKGRKKIVEVNPALLEG